ncbi:alginate lyase family protein [Limibacter armeniacum]|uniref:alginate lyase family protein n=1 Tax=Limibacter armeniacum TaxID=466084 RepID=UPI002FE5C6DF
MHKAINILLILLAFSLMANAQHPNLILTQQAVKEIRGSLGKYPLLDQTVENYQNKLKQALETDILVPVPKDPGGGYTHEKHKQNGKELYMAGILFQLTGDKVYVDFAHRMLKQYAALYPTLPLHPERKSNNPGKLFWQGLNESVWLVQVSQAYDCIYDALSAKERAYLEEHLFHPMVQFFTEENVRNFDIVHNHGTWCVAGVGMISYVMGDLKMVEKCLYSTRLDGSGGFMAQLEQLFSPDGYYTEGPYYQRYAMMPFILFAEAIQNNQPEKYIYQFRDGVIAKASNAILQLTYTNGRFFPINDALKEKTYLTQEMICNVDIAYSRFGHANGLLSIAEKHGEVLIAKAGLEVAKAVAEGKSQPFDWQSIELKDGANGDEGGIGILRAGSATDQLCILMKYAGQGMGHGHFDKLSISMFDNNQEILQDYGAARFLNTVQKEGGRYLPENKTWAKQTIAHNTLVVDGTSNFDGNLRVAQQQHADCFFFETDKMNSQVMSAKDHHAYPGVKMQRTIAMLQDSEMQKPIIVDLFRVKSDMEHQYDVPFYYQGHLIATNFEYKAYKDLRKTMGSDNGYQHLWLEAEAIPEQGSAQFTWLNDSRFYTITTITDANTQLLMGRIGANDPNFNLRNEPCLIVRQPKAGNHLFASVIEPHGVFDPTSEYTAQSSSKIKGIEVISDTDDATIVRITSQQGKHFLLMVANDKAEKNALHSVDTPKQTYQWTGPFKVEIENMGLTH